MTCPRCTIGTISTDTNRCVLCGWASPVQTAVAVEAAFDIDEAVRRDLGRLFELDRRHRRGPLSAVYLARDLEHEERVALKVVPRAAWNVAVPDDVFQRGLGVVAALDHPHIVPVRRFGATARFFWYAMRYVGGRSLAERLRASGPLKLDVGLRLITQVGSALHYAHRRGIVHGNLKPSNVLVDEQDRALVTDFQVAAILERMGVGGPGLGAARRAEYVAPEESPETLPAAAADQYALAVLAYECLSGAPPFSGATVAEITRRQRRETPPSLSDARPEVPTQVSRKLQRALSSRPAERFPTVLRFVASLGVTGRARPEPSPAPEAAPASSPNGTILVDEEQPTPPPARPRYVGAAVVAVLVLTAIVGSVWWMLRSSGAVESAPLAVAPQALDTLSPSLPVDTARAAADSARREVVVPPARPARPPTAAARVPAPLPRPALGRLSISATPWGQLYVDDSLVGNTPKLRLPVAVGTHRLRIVRSGFEPFEQSIEVTPGQEVRLTGLVLRELKP